MNLRKFSRTCERVKISWSLVIIIALHYTGDSDYDIVNALFTFGREGDTTQCLNISIIDDGEFEAMEMFTLLLTVSDDYNSRVLTGKPAIVAILDNDEQVTESDEFFVAMASGISVGVVFFLLILVMAGSISCLVVALLKRQR